jgi:hypothetical protein
MKKQKGLCQAAMLTNHEMLQKELFKIQKTTFDSNTTLAETYKIPELTLSCVQFWQCFDIQQ